MILGQWGTLGTFDEDNTIVLEDVVSYLDNTLEYGEFKNFYKKVLPVGTRGNYILVVPTGWLGAEELISITCTSPTLTVVSSLFSDNYIQATVIGVSPEAAHKLHFTWHTPTRSDCYTVFVEVMNC